MAWSDVRPFFKSKLDGLGYTEWPEGFFTAENLPDTVVDKAYHVIVNDISGDRQNQCDQESTLAVEMSTLHKGYRYPAEAIDAAVAGSEEIMSALVAPLARTMTTGILNVVFNKANIAPIDNTNDNTVVVTHSYSVRVITGV